MIFEQSIASVKKRKQVRCCSKGSAAALQVCPFHIPTLIFSAFFLVLNASAQDVVERVTLEKALEMFSQNNLELRIARSSVLEMSGLARQATAYPNPFLAITHEPLFQDGETQSESYFNLNQRIEWPSLRAARSKAANRIVRAAVNRVSVDSLRLAFEVARVYIEAVAAEARKETIRSVMDVFRDAESAIVIREGEGDVSGYDVRRLRIERARYESALAVAELNLRDEWRRLAALIRPEGEGVEMGPAAPLNIPIRQPQLEEVILAARLHRPEIAFAREQVEAAGAYIEEARASRLPSPTVTAGYKRQSDGFNGPLLGIALPVPVLSRNQGNIEARQTAHFATETRLILVERQIENDVNRAYQIYVSLAKRVQLVQDKLLVDVGDLLRTARVSYDEGEMSLLELLDAAEAYRDAKIMTIDILADYQISHFDLLRATGGSVPSMQ